MANHILHCLSLEQRLTIVTARHSFQQVHPFGSGNEPVYLQQIKANLLKALTVVSWLFCCSFSSDLILFASSRKLVVSLVGYLGNALASSASIDLVVWLLCWVFVKEFLPEIGALLWEIVHALLHVCIEHAGHLHLIGLLRPRANVV